MSSREVVTLQVGHYSNFIGTHWWNLQEASFVYDAKASTAVKELNHDVLFREGRNLMGDVTYTPRLISLDLKGSLNTLRQEGTLYDVRQEEDVNWHGDVTLHSSVTPAKNEFLRDLERDDITEVIESSAGAQVNADDRDEAEATGSTELTEDNEGQVFGPKFYHLDNDVKVWSDFLRIHLHPRSVNMVQEYSHDNETEPFDIFGCGESLFSNYNRRTSVEDQIHFFTEECDNLQGFHVLADVYNGFGGMAAWVAQYLEEEFPNKGSLAFGVHPAFFPNSTSPERIHRLISSLLSYDKMVAHSSLFVPLSLATNVWKTSGPAVSFPYLKYQADLNYHTSAVLAASLDTCTLPYRLETGASRLSDMTHSFHHSGRRVAALSSSLPFPMSPSATFVESLMSQQGRLPWCPVSPGVAGVASPYMQSVVVRGIPKSRVKSLSSKPDIQRVLSRCDTAEDILKLYVTEMFPSTLNAGCVVNAGCKVTSPFPHIFSPRVTQTGWLTDTHRQSKQGVDIVPVMTALQNSPEAGSSLQQLHSEASKVNIRKYHQFLENGMEEDDFRESLEHVATLYQCYES